MKDLSESKQSRSICIFALILFVRVRSLCRYVDTPYGQVKTFQVGPTDGKKLLLVHGISTPAPIWKNVLGNLTKAGYRVLVYE